MKVREKQRLNIKEIQLLDLPTKQVPLMPSPLDMLLSVIPLCLAALPISTRLHSARLPWNYHSFSCV